VAQTLPVPRPVKVALAKGTENCPITERLLLKVAAREKLAVPPMEMLLRKVVGLTTTPPLKVLEKEGPRGLVTELIWTEMSTDAPVMDRGDVLAQIWVCCTLGTGRVREQTVTTQAVFAGAIVFVDAREMEKKPLLATGKGPEDGLTEGLDPAGYCRAAATVAELP
jgi:hypothetical protein